MNATVLHVSPRVAFKRLVLSPTALRLLLLAGCALAIAAVAMAGDPAPLTRADPELALLLRGMAAIKGLLVAAAIAIGLWRFGHPIRRTVATGYVAGTLLVAGATASIWQLSFIVPAAALFHAGGLLLLVVAWRDDGRRIFPMQRSAAGAGRGP